MLYMIKRFRHHPFVGSAVILFASIIVMGLCSLQHSGLAARTHFAELYQQIDVRCTITSLSGTSSDGLQIYPAMIFRFTGEGNTDPKDQENVAEYVENVQIKGSRNFQWNGKEYTLVGITSIEIAPSLRPENGCTIFYNEGVAADLFGGDGMHCIVPLNMMQEMKKQALPEDVLDIWLDNSYEDNAFEGALQIMGTYHSADEKTVYCPWKTYVRILRCMGEYEMADALHMTLRDNDNVHLLREITKKWLVAPDPALAGKAQINGISLALDIDDSQLRQAAQTLENSMTVNRITSILVLLFSAVSGAFAGYLMIRCRKKEISLMRTMGTSNSRIYLSFVAEQFIFVILGAIVGGLKFMWSPALWLVLFACVYFIGLSAALLVMLRKNLLTTIKEDE